VQQQRELPGNLSADARRLRELAADREGASDTDNSDADEDGPAAEARRTEQLRRHVEKKWSFPTVAGRRAAPGSVEFEFMRALIQIFQLEDTLQDEVLALRDKMCQNMKVSQFGNGIAFENPCFPLVLRDVTCPWCCVACHVDVTSHPVRGPGLWVCENCDKLYDRDAMQARLVELLESVVQAWQAQEVNCKKCKSLRTSNIQLFCECYGRFQARFNASDIWLVLRMLRSLVGPHDLPWLGEALELYERAPLYDQR
jgi:DNA polymerase epsilon subunit 1